MSDNSIRRIVWIMVDGISAAKIRSCCNPEENTVRNPDMPLTFFDELAEKSFVATNAICSGPYTQVAMGGQFTGLPPHEHGMDAHYKYSKFLKNNSASFPVQLDKADWHTYFTGSLKWLSMTGVHDYVIPLSGFQKINKEPSAWDMNDNKMVSLWRQDKEKSFLFVHDHFLHDHPDHGIASESHILTTKAYEKIIYECGENLRRMLKVMAVTKEDFLVVSSDHGLTIDSATFLPNSCSNTEGEWSLEMKEVHIRNLFMVRHKSITPALYRDVFSDQYIPKVLELALEGEGLPLSRVAILCDKENAISSGGGNFALINNKCYRDDYGDQIFSLRTDKEKWICQPNIGPKYCEYYDLVKDPTEMYPKEVMFSELPAELREYIVGVQNLRSFWRRLWLYAIASKRKTRFKKTIADFKRKLFHIERHD